MLRHLFFGLEIALAWFCMLSLCAAVCFVALRPFARRWLRKESAVLVPLALRLLPAGVSMGGVIGLAIPAFAWLEPVGTAAAGERLGTAGLSLALGGAALLVASNSRGLRAVFRTRRAVRALAADATRAEHAAFHVPLVVTDSPAPVMVLDGIVRPRLFVSRSVMDALTQEELDRAVAHELVHHRARDNAKRRLLAFAPDLVAKTALARELEAQWQHAAELKADAGASGGSEAHAVALASALVKVARLSVGRPPLHLDRAALHDGRPVAERVRRLLGRQASARPVAWRARAVAVLAAALALSIAATAPATLVTVQRITEFLVRLP